MAYDVADRVKSTQHYRHILRRCVQTKECPSVHGLFETHNLAEQVVVTRKSLGIFSVLGAFAKLQTATISFVVSVCLSVSMEQLGSHLTDFHEI
jgi:hypothetical protein